MKSRPACLAILLLAGCAAFNTSTQVQSGRRALLVNDAERALKADPDDLLARLYFGLTLARTGEESRGRKEILGAMAAIPDWLEYIQRSRPFEAYWDPLREIRKAIEAHIKSPPGSDGMGAERLVTDGEWLGDKMEDEIERMRQDERRQFDRDFDRRRGLSVGIGIGF